ncbi:hypothetical protein [Sandarakinorhabdus sp. DWP1-3-1]|uniref:hypothetical protein n=1 Tax=Sandarakinorhabdus sp. DWP1-3-1 TaxID=2804627 RepID=UPI003CF6C83D
MITRLYGVAPGGSGFLLLHHRAALFLVVVVICCWAIADPAVRRLAAVATAISMVGFLVLYAQAGRPPALRTIAIADLVGLLPLVLVAWLAFRPVPA